MNGMRRSVTHFEVVSVKATRRFKDPKTGRPRQQSKTFEQTINPFNKNAVGDVKTRSEILTELYAERDRWLGDSA